MSWKRFLRNSLFFAGLALQAQPNYPQGWAIAPPNDPWWHSRAGKSFVRQQCRIVKRFKLGKCVKVKRAGQLWPQATDLQAKIPNVPR
jgi:hypothetical protein